MPFRDLMGDLRAKAAAKGYSVERSVLKERVHLIRPDGEKEINPARGHSNWRMEEARKFLDKLPDA